MTNLDSAFKPLEKLIGTWEAKGRTVGATEDNIFATTTFEPILDGKYLQINGHMTFKSKNANHEHDSLEIISYDAARNVFPSAAYSTLDEGAGSAVAYEWEVEDDGTIIHRGAGAIYRGTFTEDNNVLTGGWRPDTSEDDRDEASYDLTMTRVS